MFTSVYVTKQYKKSYLLHLRNRMLVTDCIILCMPSLIRLPASFSLITPTIGRMGRKNSLKLKTAKRSHLTFG